MKSSSSRQGITIPAGRSPGSISAIYSGLDQQAALEARKGAQVNSEAAKLNEQAVKRPLAPEKVIPVHSKRREPKNPADKEIFELRKQGKEVPKELLDKKFAHNRARHSQDLRR